MGLINWFKDKVIQQLEHDFLLLRAEIEALKMQLETMKGQIIGLRASRYRKADEDNNNVDIDEIRKAFGGAIPIELRENYGNRQKYNNPQTDIK